MAARVNTRFVLLLSLSLIVLVALAAGVYFVFIKKSPEELFREGEMYTQQAVEKARQVDALEGDAAQEAFAKSGEDYLLAAESYGKAFEANRTDVEMLLKYINTLKLIHVDTTNKAGNILREIDARLQLATQLEPEREDILQDYYEQTLEQLLWGGGSTAANNILSRIATHVTTKLETDPNNRIALKYRGIVRTLRLDPSSSDYDDYLDAKEDLDAAARQLPDDPIVRMYQAKWHIAEARRVQNDPQEVEENVEQAKEISAEALAMAPDDLETQFKRIEVLLAHPIYRSKSGVEDEAKLEAITEQNKAIVDQVRGIVDKLEARLTDDPRPLDAVLRLCDIMTRLDREIIDSDSGSGQTTPGMQRTEKLLRKAIAAQPLNVVYKTYLGNILKLQMDLDGSLAAYKAADEIAAVGTAEMVLRELHFKRQARYEIANIELIKAENEQDPEVREQKLKVAEDAVEHLDQVLDNKAPIWLLRGKVAMLRGDNPLAAQYMSRAVELFDQGDRSSIEAMLLAARAYQRGQMWGAAADILELIARQPGISQNTESETRIRTQLAEIYINANELEKAQTQIRYLREGRTLAQDGVPEDIPALAPEAPATKMLAAGLELKLGNVDQAVALYGELDALDQPAVARNIARVYRSRGDNDQARQILDDYLAENPADLSLITEYARVPDTDAQRRDATLTALLDRAQQAGADSKAVNALRTGVTPVDQTAPGSREDFVKAQVDMAGGDDLSKALVEASLWKRLGEEDKARVAFRRAQALDPDNHQVLLMGISYAVADRDQAKLDRLVARASEANVDLVGGDFVRGQIAAEQKNYAEAITYYNQGLEKRPVYPEGWRVLGDLYLARGSQDQAVEAYNTAISQKPDNVQALVGLSDAHMQRSRYADAVRALRDAVRHNDTNAALVRKYLETETQYGDPAEALRVQRRIADRYPNVLANRLALALLLVQAGEQEQAVQELVSMEQKFGQNLQTVGARALIARQMGDSQGSNAVYEEYLKDRGAQATVQDHVTAARHYRGGEASEAAINAYRTAAGLDDSESREVSRELADYLFTLGRFDEAAELYGGLLADAVIDDADRERLMRRQTETLLRKNDIDGAEAMLAAQPDEAPVLMLRSMVARARGDDAAAMSLLNDAITRDPGYGLAYVQRGMLKLGDSPDAALADADKALELEPANPAARRLRTQVMLIQGKVDEAINGLSAVLADNPGDTTSRTVLVRLYLQRGQTDAARELIAQGQRVDPNNPAWPQLSAQVAMAGGNPAERIARLEEAVADSPRAITVQALAEAYLDQNRARDAVALFEQHAQLVNANPALQARRGHALIQAGNRDGGARLLTLAMQRSRNRGELMVAARAADVALGTDRAIQLLDVAANAAPANRLSFELAKAALLVGNGAFERAIETLPSIEAMAAESDASAVLDARRMLAMSYYQTGRFDDAEAAYRKVIEANPEDAEALNNLAYLLANEQSDPASALPLAEKAVALTQPPQATVLDTLGFVQLRAGQAEKARQTLEKAVSLQPIPAVHLHLAQAYLDLDLATKARQSLQTAIDLARTTGDQDTQEKARRLLDSL